MKMATINIGGVSVSGKNIEIKNNQVFVDGVQIVGSLNTNGASISTGGTLEIRVIEGCIENLRADGSIHCGDIAGSADAGGSIRCGDVGGSANAGGSVTCGDVGGSASAGGSVTCENVSGSVSAINVRRR